MSKPSWMKNIVKVVGVVVGLFAGCIVASAQQPVKLGRSACWFRAHKR